MKYALLFVLMSFMAQAQIVNIPDANFKNALVNTLCVGNLVNNNFDADVDTNDDGEVQLSEALTVTRLNVPNQGITDLTGIEAFQNMRSLNCNSNQIATLTLNNFFNLVSLYCSDNSMTSITITNCFNLNQFHSTDNLMTSIDLSLTGVSRCSIQSCPNLVSINLKNGIMMDSSFAYRNITSTEAIPPPPPSLIGWNPNLLFICADDYEIDHIETMNLSNNNPGLVVSSYCTSVPGGSYNTVTGSVNVNCDTFNIPASQVKISYSNGFQSGYTFTSSTGHYVFFVPAGTYTITPEFEVPNYFSFSPSSSTIEFVEAGNTQVLNFCATPSAVNANLEITLIPIGVARPGFDAQYQIQVRNKGYQEMSGTVTFSFNDAVSDFVSAVPVVTTQSTGSLTWDFTDLVPFEARNFLCKLNINSPTEIPAVNIGDQLSYTATVFSSLDDITPGDNIALLKQTVVGSYDPNDKLVLEGGQISTAQTGDYLHYVVRFQNTGTYPAENIVVKDMLDDNLDWSTLEMLSSSHPYRSTLTNGNQLEIFYDGINLPPSSVDEPGSNGYIAFKIKPKATIAIDDVIENTAGIYFDFNFPIVTNTVSTTVTALGSNDFATSVFTIYPNPTRNLLHITLADANFVKEVSVCNALGQKLMTVTNTETIEVSTLSQGAYFITVTTENGKGTQKFVKL
ncbi:DUF7619 domain-containing protein [Flavobacterium terrisoli]|uniref:DUF7619 domain-containing protein n=1 Tax=Flavobacterium terrisoli TaxID=3242195 RepID=UPI002542A875|nr:T9SS type A sorting domain-containing protein [Flavobacterium buctense]